jgi:hypothetical protein
MAALLLKTTWPFHLSLWAALAIPDRRGGLSPALRSPIAIAVAGALLVVDISVNPTVELFGMRLGSIHRYFCAPVTPARCQR